MPRGRTLYAFAFAQLTTVTTSAGVLGAHVQTASTAMSPAQFLKAC